MEPAMKVRQCLLALILTFIPTLASAETVEVSDDLGGFVFLYQARWEKLAAKNVNVRVSGRCTSACTVLVGYIPRQNICVTPTGSFGFHSATMQFATDALWKIYPEDIRNWITQHGGLTFLHIMWLQAPETYRFFRKC